MLPPAPSVAVERADAVFEARVENVYKDGGPDGVGSLRFELEVLRQWKGELGAAVQLATRSSSAACGRNLTLGKVYLVYASKQEDGQLTDNLCSRTRLASTADEDLAVLGPGTGPGSRPVAEPTSREPPRIAPPPPDLGGPAPIARRGCAVVGEGADLTGLVLLGALGMAGLTGMSRRPRRGR